MRMRNQNAKIRVKTPRILGSLELIMYLCK